jgi:ABC-type dipeptide/oligopeptide/nickel transport system ATPase component
MSSLLKVDDLSVQFATPRGNLRAVRNADVIEVDAGGIVKPDNER